MTSATERRGPRAFDRVSVGAYRDALRCDPHGLDELGRAFLDALRCDPHGLDELGRAFLDAHGGDVTEAVAALLFRVCRLERQVEELKTIDAGTRLGWLEGDR